MSINTGRLQGGLVLNSIWPWLKSPQSWGAGWMLPQINPDAESRPSCLLSKWASRSYLTRPGSVGWGAVSGNSEVRGRSTVNSLVEDPAGWLSSPAILYPASLLHSQGSPAEMHPPEPQPLRGHHLGTGGIWKAPPASPSGRKGIGPGLGKCGADLSLETCKAPEKSGAEVSGPGWWLRGRSAGAKLRASARRGFHAA